MNRLGIGIDFGTTNSAAAVFDGTGGHLIDLEATSPIMPSATYIDRDLQTLTGQEAVVRYVADNTGRQVELIPEVIGEAALALGGDPGGRTAPQLLVQKVYGAPALDSGLRGRLFHGTKRLLGNADIRRLSVFDQRFRLVALITPILLRIAGALGARQCRCPAGVRRSPRALRGPGRAPRRPRAVASRRSVPPCRHRPLPPGAGADRGGGQLPAWPARLRETGC